MTVEMTPERVAAIEAVKTMAAHIRALARESKAMQMHDRFIKADRRFFHPNDGATAVANLSEALDAHADARKRLDRVGPSAVGYCLGRVKNAIAAFEAVIPFLESDEHAEVWIDDLVALMRRTEYIV